MGFILYFSHISPRPDKDSLKGISFLCSDSQVTSILMINVRPGHRQKPGLCSSRFLDSLSLSGTVFPASGCDLPVMMAWCVQALRSFRKSFYLQWMCLCQCLGTQLLFALLCWQQWPWECWLPGRPLVTPLCHSPVCSAEGPLMGHRIFAGGTFLISCCSASPKFLISPWAHGIVQNGICVLPGILFWCGVCLCHDLWKL